MRNATTYRSSLALLALAAGVAVSCLLVRCGEDLSPINGADTGVGNGKTPCKNAAQCKTGEVCRDGFCMSSGGGEDDGGKACAKQIDCGTGEECRGGRCVVVGGDAGAADGGDGGLPNGDAESCTASTDCGTGYRCDTQAHRCAAAAIVSVDPTDIDFGAVHFGSQVTRTITVSNKGLAALKVIEVAFDTGTNPDPQNPRFTATPSAAIPATLKPAEHMGVDVTYRQDDEEPDTGTLLVSTDDLDHPLTRVPLKSTYKGPPDLAIVDPTASPLNVLYPKSGDTDEYKVDFGDVALDTDNQRVVTFFNASQGEGILVLKSATADKKTANEFRTKFRDAVDTQKDLTPPVYLSPGDMAQLVVDYHPTQKVQAEETDLAVLTNDGDVNNDQTAADSTLTLKLVARAGYNPPGISVSKQQVSFGEVPVNGTASDTVRVCNTGGDTLNVKDTSGLETANTDFSITPSSLLKTLSPTDCFDITVTFAPKAIGQAGNNLFIDSDDAKNPHVVIALTGTGANPTISVFPTSIDFGTVFIGGSATPVTVTVKNTGVGLLKVNAIALTAGSSSDYKITSKPGLPATLHENQADSISFNVEFTPTAKATANGAVQIDCTDLKSPQVIIPITGVGDYSAGHPCKSQSECPGSFCVDGYCCSGLCNDLCERCDIPGSQGICTAVPQGTDPDNECTQEAVTTCGKTGFCAGSRGKCELYGVTTVCAAQTCVGGIQVNAKTCSGTGTCVTPTPATVDCTPYVCDNGTHGCYKSCTTNAECAVNYACSAANQCKKAQGQTCQSDGECASNLCSDGYCCNARCDGVCETCKAAGQQGFCDPVADGNDPAHGTCTKSPPCGQTGWCDGKRGCAVTAKDTVCSTASCSGNISTLADKCDGSGTCADGGTQDCGSVYRCNTTTGLCRTQCNDSTECMPGYSCKTSTHECLKDNGQSCNAGTECMSGGCCGNVCTALNTLTDCGSCGTPCSRANATASCATGTCTFVSCNTGFDNCDSNTDNGCEVDHTSYSEQCASAEDLGSANGEFHCDTALACSSSGSWDSWQTRTGRTGRWFKAHAHKCTSCSTNVGHRITLSAPSGAGYNLCFYTACGTPWGGCTYVAGGTNQQVVKTMNNTDFDYWIEVKYNDGSSCSNWTLSIEYNKCGILGPGC